MLYDYQEEDTEPLFPSYSHFVESVVGQDDTVKELVSRARVSTTTNGVCVEVQNRKTTVLDIEHIRPRAVDEFEFVDKPRQFVDYLVHEWEEEDIWRSRRYISSNARNSRERTRLENAIWRVWAKTRLASAPIDPETLNWQKEDDFVWLNGPFESAKSSQNDRQLMGAYHGGRSNNSGANQGDNTKRSILKNASSSEKFRNSASRLSSTPHTRRVHFNEDVEQCMILDLKPRGFIEQNASDWSAVYAVPRISTLKRSLSAFGGVHRHNVSDANIVLNLPRTILKEPTDIKNIATNARRSSKKAGRRPRRTRQVSSKEIVKPVPRAKTYMIDAEDSWLQRLAEAILSC